MNEPSLVTARLGDETPLARVPLGGDDAVFVTPTRTLLYRADGLLSDESVTDFPHDADRVELRRGRRKATVRLGYVDETREFSVPAAAVSPVLQSVLGGVLRTAGVLDADEECLAVFRFSELTLVVAESRVVKHVGSAVWDADYEVLPFADLTGLDYEEGRVATQVVVEVDGRPDRVKVPNSEVGPVRKAIEDAVFAFHGVDSREALDELVGVERDESDAVSQFTSLVGGSGDAASVDSNAAPGEADGGESTPSVKPSSPSTESHSAAATAGEERAVEELTGAPVDDDLAAEVAALRDAVERQNALIEAQGETIERLVDELRRGR